MGLLSYFEHLRNIRTSSLLNAYLLFTVVFDAARSRSYSLNDNLETISAVFTTRVGIKLFLAIFEAKGKQSLLLPEYASYPAEATSGVYSRALFWWQNSLFKKGFSNTLSVDDLFDLDKHLRSEYLHHLVQSAWARREFTCSLTRSPRSILLTFPLMVVNSKGSHALFNLTMKRLKWPLLAVVFPRACLIAFNFCQPFLINRAIAYSDEPNTSQTTNVGYGLIGAYFLVYVGIAVHSTCGPMLVLSLTLVRYRPANTSISPTEQSQ